MRSTTINEEILCGRSAVLPSDAARVIARGLNRRVRLWSQEDAPFSIDRCDAARDPIRCGVQMNERFLAQGRFNEFVGHELGRCEVMIIALHKEIEPSNADTLRERKFALSKPPTAHTNTCHYTPSPLRPAFGRFKGTPITTASAFILLNLQVVSARSAPHVFNNIPPPTRGAVNYRP
ncbi:hypothetical protein CC86DRAFT_84207 [Ophiobolus disseminans]|uniref:Uncharacterized protein n=1 Tax=Ophiobolus disseminans TaxID=1469910 RepID=A0A6A7AF87_9PLEO|nr:hypothetical protein CC86DRAFT_84207 [Ophiobolus disseminans]